MAKDKKAKIKKVFEKLGAGAEKLATFTELAELLVGQEALQRKFFGLTKTDEVIFGQTIQQVEIESPGTHEKVLKWVGQEGSKRDALKNIISIIEKTENRQEMLKFFLSIANEDTRDGVLEMIYGKSLWQKIVSGSLKDALRNVEQSGSAQTFMTRTAGIFDKIIEKKAAQGG